MSKSTNKITPKAVFKVFKAFLNGAPKKFDLGNYKTLPFYHNLEVKFENDSPELVCTFHYERKEDQKEKWDKVFELWLNQYHKLVFPPPPTKLDQFRKFLSFSAPTKQNFPLHGNGYGDNMDHEGENAYREYNFTFFNGNKGKILFIPTWT